jgi:hypothetical protein
VTTARAPRRSAHEVGDPGPARVFEDDAVARPELGLERALDRIERAARDRDVAADPVAREVRLGARGERRQLGVDAVQPVRRVDARERTGERGEKAWIRIAARQVPHARG